MAGNPAGQGVSLAQKGAPSPASREDLLKESRARFLRRGEKPWGRDKPLWKQAQEQVALRWLEAHFLSDSKGNLRY